MFLTGEFVYKLKKPVNFGFLDFSTIELRKVYCKAEVELNSRLAPSIYLKAAPITLGRRPLCLSTETARWSTGWSSCGSLTTTCSGPQVNARGELTGEHMDALVKVLVPFYENAATGERHRPLRRDRSGQIQHR